MAKKIVITAVASLLSFFLIFLTVKYAADILQPDMQAAGQTESTVASEPTDPADTIADTTLPDVTTAPETKPTETEQLPSQESTQPQKGENAVTPTDPPVSTTQPLSQEQELPEWKQMYINYATAWRTKYDHFALVYIDGDEIPELYMYGSNRSELCAYRDGALISQQMSGIGGGNYHEKSGNFLNVCAEGDYLAMYVYELTDIFRQTFYGREDKSVNPPVYYIGEYASAVSEEEFKSVVNQYIDTTKTVFLHQNAVTFDAFPAYVTDF